MKYFQKLIGSIVLGPNHLGNFFQGKIWIFVEVIFFDPSEFGVLPKISRCLDFSRKCLAINFTWQNEPYLTKGQTQMYGPKSPSQLKV